jgi:cell division protein ZapD
LEYLFNQLKDNMENLTLNTRKTALIQLLQIIDFIDRPDLKSKLAQMLTQQATTLSQLKNSPQVDTTELKKTLAHLDELIENVHHNRKKIGDTLRNNEFLNQIRMQMNNPGGICPTKSSALVIWQQRSPESCLHDLKTWIKELQDLNHITHWILKITRESAVTHEITAHDGFYNQSLDPNLGQMVQIALPSKLYTYPEVSIGKHHLTIRFLMPNFHENGRAAQLRETILFKLSCCKM